MPVKNNIYLYVLTWKDLQYVFLRKKLNDRKKLQYDTEAG